jgi:flagellar hook-length control protein FliK
MPVSAEPISLETAGARAVVPLAKLRESGESLLLAVNSAMPGGLAAMARANAELSPLSMLLGRLTNVAADEPPVNPSPLTDSPVQSKEMAEGLQKSFTHSGLFYESHLARWAEGKHSIEELRLEPQAKQPRDAAPSGDKPASLPGSAVAENLEPLVRRQLDLIENPTLLWRGDVWPGQSASLEMRPDQNNAGEPPTEIAPWTARLRLALPQLGGIDATVMLKDNSVTLTFNAKDGGAATTLQNARADLQDSLLAQGVHMAGFSVKSDATA